jgi:glutamine amidotransferase
MQLMFEESSEMGIHQGLGLISGKVRRFGEARFLEAPSPPSASQRVEFIGHNLKVPHMGWNQLTPTQEQALVAGITAEMYAYFVHSYYCDPAEVTTVLSWTDYGFPFASIVAKDNVYGLQFHPEKSQGVGLQILQNFVKIGEGTKIFALSDEGIDGIHHLSGD